MKTTNRMEYLPTEPALRIFMRARELEARGVDVFHLEIGEPDFSTPKKIVAAGVKALQNQETHYTDSRGIGELREAVASYYNRKYNVDVSGEQVVVTMGVSPALLTVLSIIIESPGDEVILGNPCYPCYPNFINYLNGKPVFVPARAEDGFQPLPREIKKRIGPRTKAIMVNSPSNPAGTLMPPEHLEEISSFGVPVISDEIYHGLTYGKPARSTLEFADNTFVLNGFSKLFAMTGWRLGYIIAPRESVRALQILQQNFFISPNAFVQRAAVTALTEEHPEIGEMIELYDKRRRFLIKELPALGLNFPVEPDGAFYFFINAEHAGLDSYKLAFDILEKAGVALAPGIDFGASGEGHLRISYANSLDNLAEGVRRLKKYFAEID